MLDSYKYLYEMEPDYEARKVAGVGWWKLKWKPIKNGTYNLYISDHRFRWSTKMIGFRYYRTDAHNGWHRAWDGFHIEIGLFFCVINFWLHWNFYVHEDGPSDGGERRPLKISNAKKAKTCNQNSIPSK